tara:strand:- start:407 stop:1036 length:630 start_codon:yes stop_codon:yes gene_type:complete
MNDFMSLGIHRLWKKSLINMMSPSVTKNLLDVACGTGDIAKLFLDKTGKESNITCVDPNKKMIDEGKNKLTKYKNINWIIAPAEKLPLNDNTYDYYSISFGLRNTTNLDQALSEAYRVLRPGGRYLCLEFSKIQNTNLNLVYKNYSKLIPIIGSFIVGEKEPYEYLVNSIEQFINQEELIDLMKKHKFQKCSYRNFSNGIVSIHSGWKI